MEKKETEKEGIYYSARFNSFNLDCISRVVVDYRSNAAIIMIRDDKTMEFDNLELDRNCFVIES